MSPTLEYSAIRFLNHWVESEEALHQSLQNPDADSIRKALAYFKVSRGFNGIKNGDVKANRVAAALVENDKYVTPNTAAKRVESLTEDLARSFKGKYLVSAASKLLWLRRGTPFIIYDSRAIRALRKQGHSIGDRDYDQYSIAWRSAFRDRQQGVVAAVKRLPEIRSYTAAASHDWHSISNLVATPWFAERVFDQYLWLKGARDA